LTSALAAEAATSGSAFVASLDAIVSFTGWTMDSEWVTVTEWGLSLELGLAAMAICLLLDEPNPVIVASIIFALSWRHHSGIVLDYSYKGGAQLYKDCFLSL
jgi:hypothetical protein